MVRCTQGKMVICLVVMAAVLCGSAVADMEDNITYQGNKARITVGKIKDKSGDCPWEVAAAVGEMLSTALANNEKFIVLASQEEVDELIDEIELGQSDYVEEGRGADKGLMEGADVLVTGAVTGFEPDAGGSGGGLGGLKNKAFGAIGASKKEAKILMDIKLIDIRTRRIIKAMSLEGKASKWKAGAVGGGWTSDLAMAGALSVYKNEPMENAIREVLRKAVDEIAKQTPKEYYRYKGQGQYSSEYGSSGSAGGSQGGAATQTASAASGGEPAGGAAAVKKTEAVAENMSLYTKYDFVPGDKVIFFDDLHGEEEGEFPMRWNLDQGVYEIARLGKDYWILATDDGYVRPKMPQGPFPESYTIEMEFYTNGPKVSGNYFYIQWMDADDDRIGEFGIVDNSSTWLYMNGKTLADKRLPESLTKGVHTMRVMATSRSLKAYIDEVRVANVPAVENFNPVMIRLHHRPYNDPDNPTLFRNFRFAEGGKSMREQLDESGKIVTHGILFDSGSHKIKGESYKTLKNIGDLLTDDPELRLSIEGHTDSDGADDYNQNLSQQRAESVRVYLINEFGIGGDRLEAKGWGESKPLDVNTTSEGKANNRRVELIKL